MENENPKCSAAVDVDAENNLAKARRENTKNNGVMFSCRKKTQQRQQNRFLPKVHCYYSILCSGHGDPKI